MHCYRTGNEIRSLMDIAYWFLNAVNVSQNHARRPAAVDEPLPSDNRNEAVNPFELINVKKVFVA